MTQQERQERADALADRVYDAVEAYLGRALETLDKQHRLLAEDLIKAQARIAALEALFESEQKRALRRVG